MTKDTGGPAFPQSNDRIVASLSIANSQGMTLRDYFAAKAMQSMLPLFSSRPLNEIEKIPDKAYAMADLMLEARGQ